MADWIHNIELAIEERRRVQGPSVMMPYEEGREAYFRGDSLELNPYDDRDGQYEEWEAGFLDSADEFGHGGVQSENRYSASTFG